MRTASRWRHLLGSAGLMLLLVTQGQSALAGTIVRISTSIGDFSIELLDAEAPLTVSNFLNYVTRNDYNATFLHRVVDDFVMQGGAYRFERFVGPVDVPTDPPIPNEFGTPNTRGTVAMAKVPDEPDSATSQWFVNISDNTELDSNNGGFTVFGNVLGEGMTVVDAIDALPTINPGRLVPSAPFFTDSYTGPWDFVYINAEITQRFSSAPHVLETVTGLMITSVDVDSGEEFISLNLNALPDTETLTLEANLESVIARREFEGMASYSSSDGRLRIPTLEVNDAGNVFLVNDVVFLQINDNPARFQLESYATP